mmetsp:Transcript_46727/g.83674  ORF Transcript_46727/g.83674 Transcript_46727/m.83674 type:complete len:210 (+) Transcript_46727:909-1538(+)
MSIGGGKTFRGGGGRCCGALRLRPCNLAVSVSVLLSLLCTSNSHPFGPAASSGRACPRKYPVVYSDDNSDAEEDAVNSVDSTVLVYSDVAYDIELVVRDCESYGYDPDLELDVLVNDPLVYGVDEFVYPVERLAEVTWLVVVALVDGSMDVIAHDVDGVPDVVYEVPEGLMCESPEGLVYADSEDVPPLCALRGLPSFLGLGRNAACSS